jgi:hypothetical protein
MKALVLGFPLIVSEFDAARRAVELVALLADAVVDAS